MQRPAKTYTVEEAKRAIERYCAYQERCHQEVENKLKQMRMIPDAVAVIISHLIEHNFLNEERFARAFSRGKFKHKSWGKGRIIRELKARRISQYNIKAGLSEISQEDYFKAFEALAQKRLDQLSTEKDKYRKRKKLADYLTYRGWEGGLVYEKVKALIP